MEHKTEFAAILEKIRSSCCLNEGDLSSITDALSALTTRRHLDQIDHDWAAQIQNYVRRRAKTNRAYIPNAVENWTVMLIGTVLAGFGFYNVLRILFQPTAMDILAVLFFAFLMVAGVYIFTQGCKDLALIRSYSQDLTSYHSKRRAIIASLPEQYRPAGHVCTHCLAKIV